MKCENGDKQAIDYTKMTLKEYLLSLRGLNAEGMFWKNTTTMALFYKIEEEAKIPVADKSQTVQAYIVQKEK